MLGCECNYDLCKTQRNKDYITWKWFDLSLYWAIQLLSFKEKGCFPVFSGLNGVSLDRKNIENGYFVTYVSSSWRKEVSSAFMKGNGCIIEIDQQYKDDYFIYCCDVSWISKFPDECEILFARSLQFHSWNNFSLNILDSSSGVQTISLKKNDDDLF